ncbi:MAG TPA: DUF1800 domain-containing protein [Planctomycetota bacterium]|nr:DUF1800 domain-containing protein [Planctomycetota bacterium]
MRLRARSSCTVHPRRAHPWRAGALGLAAALAACSSGGGTPYTPGLDLPEDEAAASRFLARATFGPDAQSMTRLQQLGYSTWLREQMEMPPSLHRPELEARAAAGQSIQQADRQEMWWRRAITAPDQLRQRVAFALSEIFVVSDRAGALVNDAIGLAEYYDILVRGAFGTYRELIEHITLSPQMGVYLSHLRNRKPDPARNLKPDENYAREIMQLFSIGLWKLAADGTLLRDGQGQPIPTYDQDDIVGLSHVFTGWTYAGSTSFQSGQPNYRPMEPWEQFHDREAKAILDDVVLPAGRDAAVELADVLDRLAAHPNVGPFLGKQLIQRLVTSNPSPGYVARVTAVWNDDGNGVRGNLGAVIRAILLDDEAMHGHRTAPETFGKLREPLLCQTALWRAFNARAGTGLFNYTNPELNLGQAALRAETVFNFFRPDFRPQGEVGAAGLVAPEFEILTHSTITMITNQLYTSVDRHVGAGGTTETQILLDLSRETALAPEPAALIDHLDVMLLGGTMSPELRTILLGHLPLETEMRMRAHDAVYLIVSSPEFAVQK